MTTTNGNVTNLQSSTTNNTNSIDAMLNIYGSKNLLPNYTGRTEINGVSFIVRDDGSILINGIATNKVWYNFCYIDFGSDTMNTWDHPYSATNGLIISSGNSNINMQYEGGNKVTYIAIEKGANMNNQIAYPMIRDARIKDDTYVSYTMTNRELTSRINFTNNTNSNFQPIRNGMKSFYLAHSNEYVMAKIVAFHIPGGGVGNYTLYKGLDVNNLTLLDNVVTPETALNSNQFYAITLTYFGPLYTNEQLFLRCGFSNNSSCDIAYYSINISN